MEQIVKDKQNPVQQRLTSSKFQGIPVVQYLYFFSIPIIIEIRRQRLNKCHAWMHRVDLHEYLAKMPKKRKRKRIL